jgi:SAM-dependent methyltransferase
MLILDVGCGKAKKGDIGIDYQRGGEADIIADAHHLPFKPHSFDRVVSFNVLEHSPNPLIFFREQWRVLKRGGKCICRTDNSRYYGWSLLFEDHGAKYSDHYVLFYASYVERLMKKAGFVKIRSSLGNYGCKKRRTKKDILFSLLAKIGIIHSDSVFPRIMVVATKPEQI